MIWPFKGNLLPLVTHLLPIESLSTLFNLNSCHKTETEAVLFTVHTLMNSKGLKSWQLLVLTELETRGMVKITQWFKKLHISKTLYVFK